MATDHVLKMLINRTFEEISLAFSRKTTAMSLSVEIKRRLPMEITREKHLAENRQVCIECFSAATDDQLPRNSILK